MRNLQFTILTSLALMMPIKAVAHAPHDPVWALAIPPTFSQNQTVFVAQASERHWRTMEILISRNGGATWSLSPKGFDNTAPITYCSTSPAFASDQLVICTTFGNGVFRSLDGGKTWARANAGLNSLDIMSSAIAVNSNSSAILWVTAQTGELYSSIDFGQTWNLVATPFSVTSVAPSADYTDDTTVVIGDSLGRTAISMNGGVAATSNWALLGVVGSGEHINKLVVPAGFLDSGTLFAGTTGGLYRSVDGGASYQREQSIPVEHVQAIVASPDYINDATVFAASAKRGVFKSTDGGDSWTELPTGIPLSNQSFIEHYTLAISSQYATDQTLMLGTYSGLGISTDGGETWIESDTRPPSLTMGIAVSPDVASDNTIFAPAYTSGGYVSRSLGNDWVSTNMGLGNITIYDAVFFKPSGTANPVLYAAQQSLILRSPDAGTTWEFLSDDPLPGQRVFPSKIALSPEFELDSTLFMGSRANGLLRSTDGGYNWQQVLLTPGDSISALKISPDFATDRTVFIATTSSDVLRSEDAGISWSSIRPAIQIEEGPFYLAISPAFASDGTLLLGTPSGLFRSQDGGDNWSQINHPQVGSGLVQAIAVSPEFATDGTALITLRGQGLFRTMDGGENWQEIASGLINNTVQFTELTFSPNYSADQTVFGISHTRILRSTNKGDSWYDVSLDVVRHEEIRQSVLRSGIWHTVPLTVFSAATTNVAIDAGSEARIDFYGTGVSWIGLTGPSSGIADVYLDGILVQSVNQFMPSTELNASVFSIQNLDLDHHEFKIVATGTQSPYAFGNMTLVDAIEVTRAGDADTDSIPDPLDNCPQVMNTGQSDADGDGAGNDCDNCPDWSNPLQIDFDNDGFGNACDADYDNDGFVGESDAVRIQEARFTYDELVDLTEDGYVDVPDLVRFMDLYQKPVSP